MMYYIMAHRFLIQRGANPNVKGQYGRTPLYRAAFAGHLNAVKVCTYVGSVVVHTKTVHAYDIAFSVTNWYIFFSR